MDVETENEDDAKEESGDEAEPEMKEAEKPEPEVAKNLGQPESAAAPTKALRMRECPVCKVTKILWRHEKSPNAKSPTLLTLDLY